MIKPHRTAPSLSIVLLLYSMVSVDHARAKSHITIQPLGDTKTAFYNVIAAELPKSDNDSNNNVFPLQTGWVQLGEGQRS